VNQAAPRDALLEYAEADLQRVLRGGTIHRQAVAIPGHAPSPGEAFLYRGARGHIVVSVPSSRRLALDLARGWRWLEQSGGVVRYRWICGRERAQGLGARLGARLAGRWRG